MAGSKVKEKSNKQKDKKEKKKKKGAVPTDDDDSEEKEEAVKTDTHSKAPKGAAAKQAKDTKGKAATASNARSVKGRKAVEPPPPASKRQKADAAQPQITDTSTAVSASASSTLEHCDLCMDNSSVKAFSKQQGYALASPRQCYRCYLLWLPVSLLMDWLQMLHKYKSDSAFKERIDAALQETAKRAQGHHLFRPQRLADASQMGVRISRRGRLLKSKDLCFGAYKFTPKQLRLGPGVVMKQGVWKGKGFDKSWLVTGTDQQGIEVEVFLESSLEASEVMLDEDCELKDMTTVACELMQSKESSLSSDATQTGLLKFLQGKAPTMATLSERAEVCRSQQVGRRRRVSSGGGAAGEKSSDGNGSDSSDSDEVQAESSSDSPGSSSNEDEDGAESIATLQTEAVAAEAQTPTGFKRQGSLASVGSHRSPGKSQTPQKKKPSAEATIDVKYKEMVLVCKAFDQREVAALDSDEEASGGDAATVVSSKRSKPGAQAKRTGKQPHPPSYWLQKLNIRKVMKSGPDRRIVVQAEKCVEREERRGAGDRLEEAARLKSHIKLVALAESLQESVVPSLEDEELEVALRSIHRAKVTLVPETLMGVWARYVQRNLSAISIWSGAAVVKEFVSNCCPFEMHEEQPFLCQTPRLASLTRFFGEKQMANKYIQIVLKRCLVQLVKSVDEESKASALLVLLGAIDQALLSETNNRVE